MANKIRKLYFAYGSNLHMEQMKGRCPESKPVTRVMLMDYKLTFRGNYRGTGVADVIPSKGDVVHGALYEISERDLRALDRYEGYPTLYDRHDVTVIDREGNLIESFLYRMNPQFVPAVPSDYYFKVIVEGFMNWDLSPIALEGLYEARDEVEDLRKYNRIAK